MLNSALLRPLVPQQTREGQHGLSNSTELESEQAGRQARKPRVGQPLPSKYRDPVKTAAWFSR